MFSEVCNYYVNKITLEFLIQNIKYILYHQIAIKLIILYGIYHKFNSS